MRYYDITNSVIVSQRQILKANPNTSFALPLSDAALADLNMAKLLEDTRPSFDADTQRVIDGAIEERDGSYYQTYSVVDRSADAIANDLNNKKAQVRAQRNARLTETDWAMMPDSPLIDYDRSVMADYRAALRDVPAQAGFPNNPLPEGPDQRPSGGGQGDLQPSIPFASWTYNTTTFVWEPPIPKPDGNAIWDEYAYQADNTTGWVTIGI
jgi:hypothetical protein